MSHAVSNQAGLAEQIVEEIDRIVRQAETSGKALEVEPARSRLFELFVTADGAGYVDEDGDPNLTVDGLCQSLAEHWGLRDAALESTANQTRLPPEQLALMRHLWSVMRMWMEWTYAWRRWDEFHRDPSAR